MNFKDYVLIFRIIKKIVISIKSTYRKIRCPTQPRVQSSPGLPLVLETLLGLRYFTVRCTMPNSSKRHP